MGPPARSGSRSFAIGVRADALLAAKGMELSSQVTALADEAPGQSLPATAVLPPRARIRAPGWPTLLPHLASAEGCHVYRSGRGLAYRVGSSLLRRIATWRLMEEARRLTARHGGGGLPALAVDRVEPAATAEEALDTSVGQDELDWTAFA